MSRTLIAVLIGLLGTVSLAIVWRTPSTTPIAIGTSDVGDRPPHVTNRNSDETTPGVGATNNAEAPVAASVPPDEQQMWIEGLAQSDVGVRSQAGRLLEFMSDPIPQRRAAAVRALGLLYAESLPEEPADSSAPQSARVARSVLVALDDSDLNVRRAAVRAVEKLGVHAWEAESKLVDLLGQKGSPGELSEIARALSRIALGGRAVLDAIELVPDRAVRDLVYAEMRNQGVEAKYPDELPASTRTIIRISCPTADLRPIAEQISGRTALTYASLHFDVLPFPQWPASRGLIHLVVESARDASSSFDPRVYQDAIEVDFPSESGSHAGRIRVNLAKGAPLVARDMFEKLVKSLPSPSRLQADRRMRPAPGGG